MKKMTKHSLVLLATTLGLLSITAMVGQNRASFYNDLSNLNNGTGICFTRVTQAFTALMVSDLKSPYLTSDFKNLTSECFNEANKTFKNVMGSKEAMGAKELSELTNESHWFLEKIQKTHSVQLSPDNSFDLSESDIVSKYAAIERMKSKFSNAIDEKMDSINTQMSVVSSLAYAFSFGVIVFSALFAVGHLRRKTFENNLEEEAKTINPMDETSAVRIDRLVENILTHHNYHNSLEAFKNYHNYLLENGAFSSKAYEEVIISEEKEEKIISSDFNKAFNSAYNQLSQKAFGQSTIIDFQFDQNLHVKGDRDALEQLFMATLTLGIDAQEGKEGSRKIVLRSKALGDIAYFKTEVYGHILDSKELEFINADAKNEDASIQTKILKELVQDLGGTIIYKNKFDGENSPKAEITIALTRVLKEAPKAELVSVVKGKKSEILRSFESEL